MDYPIKHHFSPAFSLQPWTGVDGQLCEMKRVNGMVIARRCHPNATGYERNLYRTQGLPANQEQHIELNVMKPLDTAADLALKKLLSGKTGPWEVEQREAWALYILSLMYRKPVEVRALKDHMQEVVNAGVEALEARYSAERQSGDPETFEEQFRQVNPAAAEISASKMLSSIIHSPRAVSDIASMHWSCIWLRNSKYSLLNSDYSLDRPLGLGNPNAFIALPIAPQAIFLAAKTEALASWAREESPTKLTKLVNLKVVSQAREFVWGVDESQIQFVRRHMGAAPTSPLISVTQRRDAIDAARGGLKDKD